MNDQFTALSKKLTKNLDSKIKKKDGIYFTPKSIVKYMLKACKQYKKRGFRTVLEPSCGSCQFINLLDKYFTNLNIHGVEFNEDIYKEIKDLPFKNRVKINKADYLTYTPKHKYDLIIGNPPYFVMKKTDVEEKYHDYFTGRPNIFVLFIIKAMAELKKGGLLAFVLPKNFLNCNYYNNLREHICNHFKIVVIKDFSGERYIETGQETIVMIIQKKDKKVNNEKYAIKFAENTIFNTRENIVELKKYFENAMTLKMMQFDVKVGNVVWNQVKDKLTEDGSQTRLVYSSDIVDNKLSIKQYRNPEKKNYIQQEGSKDLLLVVNRGYGKGKYKFSYCLIDTDKEYLIENHLICIKSLEDLSRDLLLEKYKLIIESLKSDKTKKFIELYCGNNALNTTELRDIVPIYI